MVWETFARIRTEEIYNALNEWDIADKVIGMIFDTMSVNTVKDKGKILHTSLGISSLSPKVTLFKCFQEFWHFINRNKFEIVLRGYY